MTRQELVEALVEQVCEDEKWLRMKSHIAGSASARGISGKRRKAYIYGAMRARGWKPKRERMTEMMDPSDTQSHVRLSSEGPITKVASKASKKTGSLIAKGKKEWQKEISRPHHKLKAAVKHYQHGRKRSKAGDPHGKVMMRRAKASMGARGATHAAAVVGGASALIPGPSLGIVGNAALAAKGTRLALAKQRAKKALARRKK